MDSKNLDSLIAERLFGGPSLNPQWYWWRGSVPSLPIDGAIYAGPRFSTAIADAWLLVERLRQNGWLVTVKEMPDGQPFWATNDPVAEPNARIDRRSACELHWINYNRPRPIRRRPWAYGDSAPEAICRAALQTLPDDDKETA